MWYDNDIGSWWNAPSLTIAEVESYCGPDPLVYANHQLPLGSVDLVKFVVVWRSGYAGMILRCLWWDPDGQRRRHPVRLLPAWAPWAHARWVPDHLVWVRYSVQWSARPFCTCEGLVSRDAHLSGCPSGHARDRDPET